MINKITITTYRDDILTLDPFKPEESEGFLIDSIDGLGPAKANINMTDLTSSDGAMFNSSRVATRNIVMKFIFVGTDIEAVRLKSYLYFPIKRPVRLKIETDHRVGEIVGYVETNEPTIFSESEGCQVSIQCPDPYFYAPNNDIMAFTGSRALFTFPFSKEVGDPEHILVGELVRDTEQAFEYSGDVETGMTIVLDFKGEVQHITITKLEDRIPIGSMVIDTEKLQTVTGAPIDAGDSITISTVSGKKHIFLTRDGEDINILNCLNKDATWFQLSHGTNVFSYAVEAGESNIDFCIYSRVVYEGM